MSLEELITGQCCPITGIPVDDFLRISKTVKNNLPPGDYASDWEVKKNASLSEDEAANEVKLTKKEYNASFYKKNKEAKHVYYIARKNKSLK